MNTVNKSLSLVGNDALETRFALKLAARLSEHAEGIAPDLGERLRVSRERALQQARHTRAVQAAESTSVFSAAGSAILGGGGWWGKLGVALPLVVLLAGLLLIQQAQFDEQIADAAEIDAALLADDVPLRAYSDPGFVEFLKTPRD